MPLPQGGVPWSTDAIHDSVAALVRSAAYNRSIKDTLIGKAWRWIARAADAIVDFAESIPHGRQIATGLLILLIVAVAVRAVMLKRLRDEQARIRVGRGRGGRRADPWSEAQSLAASGRFTDALHELYVAVLEEIAATDGIRLHRSKTSGDYWRELRRRGSPSQAAFRAFSREYDALIFGAGECSESDYRRLSAVIQPVFARARAA